MWVELVRKELPFNPDSYAHIGKLIYPNDSYSKNIVILSKNYINGNSMSDSIGISFNAEFSNGQVLKINSFIHVSPLSKNQCQS